MTFVDFGLFKPANILALILQNLNILGYVVFY